eukprot:jgi/Tetstr1/439087/TSEL_027577.t1
MAGGKKAADPTKATPARQFGRAARGADGDDTGHDNACVTVSAGVEALEDKRLEVGLAAAAKTQASTTFKRQAMERNSDSDKARKEKDNAARERREQQRREADKNVGKIGDKTRV